MTFMIPWSIIWIAVLVLAAVTEAITTDIVAVWFLPASFVSLVLSLFGVSEWVQLPVFFGLAILCILLFRPLAKKYTTPKVREFNVDALIGTKCVVTARIENIAGNGEVKVNGLYWAARAVEEETVYEVGDQVTVVAIEGVKLICK